MNEDHFAGKTWIFISFISTWKKLFFSTHEITADPFFRRCHGAVPGGWAGSSLAVFKDMGWCEVETSEQMGSRWEFPMVNMDGLWRSHKFQYVHLMAVAKFHGMDPSKNGSGCGTWQPVEFIVTRPGKLLSAWLWKRTRMFAITCHDDPGFPYQKKNIENRQPMILMIYLGSHHDQTWPHHEHPCPSDSHVSKHLYFCLGQRPW